MYRKMFVLRQQTSCSRHKKWSTTC